MTQAKLEHINITVSDSEATAKTLIDIFGWCIRWRGPSAYGGHTVHVGNEDDYLALWSAGLGNPPLTRFSKAKPLNHIGIVVDNLDATEARVIAAGYTPESYGDYEPGKRFYFFDGDGVEFEIISYA